MYKKPLRTGTSINVNTSKEGETIEKNIQRLLNNNETDITTKELIYTRPEDGVPYGTDIRGDKWEKGITNTDKVTNHVRNSRDEKYKKRRETLEELKGKKTGKPDEIRPEGESVQANSKNPE